VALALETEADGEQLGLGDGRAERHDRGPELLPTCRRALRKSGLLPGLTLALNPDPDAASGRIGVGTGVNLHLELLDAELLERHGEVRPVVVEAVLHRRQREALRLELSLRSEADHPALLRQDLRL